MEFRDLLTEAGIDPKRTKLLRHDVRGLRAWLESPDHLLSFASVQGVDDSPFVRDPDFVAHFLPGPRLPSGSFTARFVGIAQLHGRWPWSDARLPRVWVRDYRDGRVAEEAADQSWAGALGDEVGRLEIDWGSAPRAWHQWAATGRKAILGRREVKDLRSWASGSGLSLALTEEEKDRKLMQVEAVDLAQAIAAAPLTLDRLFEDRRVGMIQVRPDQGRFRQLLLRRYGTMCAISECGVEEALEAAHIVPFAERSPDRNRIGNGLLLRRDLHRLFDLLLLSVDPSDRTVWVHPRLRESSYGSLHGVSLRADCVEGPLKAHWTRRRQA